ncbi:MAG TPA: DUF1080 domain-containing protein [Acidobacteriota bacterium]|nr:DUF1080 domain-containing protein [Acidobacteriota bacterium]
MTHGVKRLPLPAIVFSIGAAAALGIGAVRSLAAGGAESAGLSAMERPMPVPDDGYEDLIQQHGDGRFHKGGWNHYGPGYFVLDPETGVLESHGGMGLMWYSAREFSDFALELEFKTSKLESNSGVFVRVPGFPTSNDYIFHSFEIQIYDAPEERIHQTGAVYDAEAATRLASRPTGEWNHMRVTFVGDHITVEVNGETVVDWDAEPRGKVADFAASGFVGLQNHDHDSSVWFRNIRAKDLTAAP